MKLLLLVLFKWDSWLSKTVNLHCKGLTLVTSVATVKQVFLGLGYLYICTISVCGAFGEQGTGHFVQVLKFNGLSSLVKPLRGTWQQADTCMNPNKSAMHDLQTTLEL